MAIVARSRTADLLLTMSIPGRNSTAAMLVRVGFLVVLVLVNVSGSRPILARGWHGVRRSALGACSSESTALHTIAVRRGDCSPPGKTTAIVPLAPVAVPRISQARTRDKNEGSAWAVWCRRRALGCLPPCPGYWEPR